jgi:hypothetical protein
MYSLDGKNWLMPGRTSLSDEIIKRNMSLARELEGNPELMAVAIGDIDGDSAPDIWIMTKGRQLINVCNDGSDRFLRYQGISQPEGTMTTTPAEIIQHIIMFLCLLAWASMLASFVLILILPRISKKE